GSLPQWRAVRARRGPPVPVHARGAGPATRGGGAHLPGAAPAAVAVRPRAGGAARGRAIGREAEGAEEGVAARALISTRRPVDSRPAPAHDELSRRRGRTLGCVYVPARSAGQPPHRRPAPTPPPPHPPPP